MKQLLIILSCAFVLGGCATVDGPRDPQDPWESMNRSVYKFNDAVDKAVLRPVAKGYDKVVPEPIDKGIDNVLANLGEPLVIVNDLLQFKLLQGASDTGRFILNSTLGLLGIFDVATPIGLEAHDEDFGQTLAHWGVGSGPYLVLPFLGPSTVRDTGGLVVDSVATNAWYNEIDIDTFGEKLGITVLSAINTRQALLPVDDLLESSGTDPYIFVREAWLQRRQNLVEDRDAGEAVADELNEEEEDALFGE